MFVHFTQKTSVKIENAGFSCINGSVLGIMSNTYTIEFRRLGQWLIDGATAVVGEADRVLTCVTLTYHSSGPIYEISRYMLLGDKNRSLPSHATRRRQLYQA